MISHLRMFSNIFELLCPCELGLLRFDSWLVSEHTARGFHGDQSSELISYFLIFDDVMIHE